ncbi:MAG: hypothetical protein IKZ61_04450 [Prevotella sp.]|nr:hypothetical protein [Prevotella sp.]
MKRLSADESLLKEEEYIHFLYVGRRKLHTGKKRDMPSKKKKTLDLLFRLTRRILIGDVQDIERRGWPEYLPCDTLVPVLNNNVMNRAVHELFELGEYYAVDDFFGWNHKVIWKYNTLYRTDTNELNDNNGREIPSLSWFCYGCLENKYKHLGDIVDGSEYDGNYDIEVEEKKNENEAKEAKKTDHVLTTEEKEAFLNKLENNEVVSALRDKLDLADVVSVDVQPSLFKSRLYPYDTEFSY